MTMLPETQRVGRSSAKPWIETESATVAGRREWVPLIALWTIVTAYNLFKPYHIDDTAYLGIARWISTHPLHPMQGLLNWNNFDEPIYNINQPHLYFYLLALWGGAFGYSEPAMHALQSLSALACILLFHRLARVLVGPLALWTTAILVLGPAFIVEQNLMVDVPLLATWLAFFNLLICDIESPNQNQRYALAALACAAALLIKYSSLILLLILCLSLLLERRKAQAWTVLIPLAALAAWSLFNFLDYGGVHIAARLQGESHDWLSLSKEAVAWVLAVGALTPLGLIAGVQSLNRRKLVSAEWAIYGPVSVGFAAMILLVASAALSHRWSAAVLWVAFFANGALVYIALTPDVMSLAYSRMWSPEAARDFGPTIYLLLWILGTTAFYVLFSPFIAARHVLLILPAVTLILVARWDRSLTSGSRIFGLAFTVIVSAGLCLSDWRFAEFYKLEAAKLAQSSSTASNVWVSGHWGWQWYAMQNGFREIDVRSPGLRPGDYYVVADDDQPLKPPPPMRLVRTDAQDGPLLNLFCTGRSARFYASTYMAPPWSLSRECLRHVTVFQIEGGK